MIEIIQIRKVPSSDDNMQIISKNPTKFKVIPY